MSKGSRMQEEQGGFVLAAQRFQAHSEGTRPRGRIKQNVCL